MILELYILGYFIALGVVVGTDTGGNYSFLTRLAAGLVIALLSWILVGAAIVNPNK